VQLATRSVPFIAMLGPAGMKVAFGWNNTQVGYIYSGFGWAYTFTQVPGAVMAQAKGPKWTWLRFPGAMCLASTMLMPVLVYPLGWFGAAICRIGVGLGQGPLYPALYGLGGLWFAPAERSRANAIVGAVWPGAQAAQNLITPLMMNGPGWEFAFWFWGAGILCFMYIFNKHGYDRPEQDPSMSAICHFFRVFPRALKVFAHFRVFWTGLRPSSRSWERARDRRRCSTCRRMSA
jgi:ACS family glucarate transporter-like MFS transporter